MSANGTGIIESDVCGDVGNGTPQRESSDVLDGVEAGHSTRDTTRHLAMRDQPL